MKFTDFMVWKSFDDVRDIFRTARVIRDFGPLKAGMEFPELTLDWLNLTLAGRLEGGDTEIVCSLRFYAEGYEIDAAKASLKGTQGIIDSIAQSMGGGRGPTTETFIKLVTGRMQRSTRNSAALDLFYDPPTEDKDVALVFKPQELKIIPTGVRTEFSANLVAIMKERSGLATKGLELKGGVIDADYRDEWKVIMRWWPINSLFERAETFRINPGDRIAQVVFSHLPVCEMIGGGFILKDNARTGGLGSTGATLETHSLPALAAQAASAAEASSNASGKVVDKIASDKTKKGKP